MLFDSPALDTANPATPGSGGNACEAGDQRIYGRSAHCDMGAYEVGAFPVTTIAYTYDPLYRLTAANYTNGTYFRYKYDAVGNRLAQTTLTITTVYTYDDANRLVNVGGVMYEWDNNIGTGCKSKTPASDDRGFLFQTGGVNYALAPTGTGRGRLFFLSRSYGRGKIFSNSTESIVSTSISRRAMASSFSRYCVRMARARS